MNYSRLDLSFTSSNGPVPFGVLIIGEQGGGHFMALATYSRIHGLTPAEKTLVAEYMYTIPAFLSERASIGQGTTESLVHDFRTMTQQGNLSIRSVTSGSLWSTTPPLTALQMAVDCLNPGSRRTQGVYRTF